MGLALSTSWNASFYEKIANLLFEIKSAGFSEIELSFNLTQDMVKEFSEIAASKDTVILSLHNFCPIPDNLTREAALPDVYSLASIDEEIRSKAVIYTKRTIDNAQSLGAKAVVLHSGRVEISDATLGLIELYKKGMQGSSEFIRLKNRAVEERRASKGPYLEQALRSLEQLARYAEKKEVAIGVETRFYYREIPALEEFAVIFEKLKGAKVFYWHDSGHAQVMENLGFYKHKDILEAYKQFLGGIHLHDVLGCTDHLAPFQGEFDFSLLKPYLKKETLKVIEAHQPATAIQLQKAKEKLEVLFEGLI